MESKAMLNDVLASIKNMVVNYSIALNEASSEFIYKEYLKEFMELSSLAKELYNLEYSLEWVTLKEANSKDIKTLLTKQKSQNNQHLLLDSANKRWYNIVVRKKDNLTRYNIVLVKGNDLYDVSTKQRF